MALTRRIVWAVDLLLQVFTVAERFQSRHASKTSPTRRDKVSLRLDFGCPLVGEGPRISNITAHFASGTGLATRPADLVRRTHLKSALATRLLERLQSRQAKVGVVGLGYVGLPLAVEFARGGLSTVGIDLDARKISAIERGQSYIPDVPSSEVAPLVSAGLLRATTDFAVVRELDTINICVPTPLRNTTDPHMSYIVS